MFQELFNIIAKKKNKQKYSFDAQRMKKAHMQLVDIAGRDLSLFAYRIIKFLSEIRKIMYIPVNPSFTI